MNVHDLMKAGAGTRGFAMPDQVGLQMLLWHDLDYRTTMMPNQLEATKIGAETRMNLRHVAAVIVLSTIVGALSSWAARPDGLLPAWRVDREGQHLANGHGQPGLEGPERLDGQSDPAGSGANSRSRNRLSCDGVLVAMRQRFTGWMFHPIGYAVAGTFTMTWLWCATLIGWMIKALIIRYGGMKAYKNYIPFFIGLILGDYITGSCWALFGSLMGIRIYRAFPI